MKINTYNFKYSNYNLKPLKSKNQTNPIMFRANPGTSKEDLIKKIQAPYIEKIKSLKLDNPNETIELYKEMCDKAIEYTVEEHRILMEESELEPVMKSCYETFLVLLNNGKIDLNKNNPAEIYSVLYKNRFGAGDNMSQLLKYSKDKTGKIDIYKAIAMGYFSTKGLELTLYEKDELVKRYCTNKNGKISIDDAHLLGDLFFKTAAATSSEERDTLFETVKNKNKEGVSLEKCGFCAGCIKTLYKIMSMQVSEEVLYMYIEYFKKMVFDITKTLIENNTDENDRFDIDKACNQFNETLEYINKNTFQIDNSLYIDSKQIKPQMKDEIPIANLIPEYATSQIYLNHIYRMDCLLNKTNYINYTTH